MIELFENVSNVKWEQLYVSIPNGFFFHHDKLIVLHFEIFYLDHFDWAATAIAEAWNKNFHRIWLMCGIELLHVSRENVLNFKRYLSTKIKRNIQEWVTIEVCKLLKRSIFCSLME